MNLRFLKIKIHHFLSYDDAEVDLTERGYCMVSGINKNPKDSAKSNGSGKSTLFNALSFALVGETLQGLKSNLGNIYYDDGCWVELEFEVDNHHYVILRSKNDKDYGTNIKIVMNGVDKSGKTFRDSQVILDQLLPDLTSELIGSVIMIGQGMPMRFTSNTPAGRKEVLEHLSQSDFMIQDLKDRIAKRSNELSDKLRSEEDKLLENNSKESVYNTQLLKKEEEYNNKYLVLPDFDKKIADAVAKKKVADIDKNKIQEELNKIDVSELIQKEKLANDDLLSMSVEKEKYVNKLKEIHQETVSEFQKKKLELTNKISTLSQEIIRLKSIKDVCPTCGQKIPNVIKQDTTTQENQLDVLKLELKNLESEIESDAKEFNTATSKVEEKFSEKVQKLRENVNNIHSLVVSSNNKILELNRSIKSTDDIIQALDREILEYQKEKELFDSNKQKLDKEIQDVKQTISNLLKDRETINKQKNEVLEHIEVVNKMSTLIKRDFRGYLLKGIIDYINSKAKEYSTKVFGCDDINFTLDGNNIDISFCGKDYENLSGGEKTKIDLLVQFSIREMMRYLRGFNSNILVLDEVLDFLDKDSSDRVIDFITNQCDDVESVFMISHHDDLELPHDSEIVVIKNEYGNSEVIS